MSALDTAEYRRLALIAAGVDPSLIPCILDTATWRRLMLAALYDLSQGGGGAGYVNGSVRFYADLPVTVGTPTVNTAYLVRENSGVWFINRKPAGIYVRLFNNGTLADWDYAGEFPSVNDSQYFRIYDTADPTKELAFDVSGISSGTTRTLDSPNRDGRIAVSDYRLLSANANAVTGDKVAADTTAGAFTLTLPATPSNGDTITVLDYAGTFDTNNLTIARNGSNIESLAENMICNVEDAAFSLVFVGSTVGWKVVPYYGTAISATEPADDVFRVVGSADSTKKLAFEVDGISASTTRTLTVPDSSGTIALTGQLTDTKIYTANDTWTKPAGAKMVHFIVIGGGGGGGSGRRDNTSTDRCGGAGGGGGGISVGWLNASAFGSTETITVGGGGTGGAARTTNGNGNPGSSGGASSIGSVVTTFASTGGGGGQGTSATGGGGSINTARIYGPDGTTGGGENGSAASNRTAAVTQFLGPSGGGGGGGISAANTTFTGGAGGTLGNARTSAVIVGGTSAASTAGGNGNTGGFNFTGSGGGGGSPDATTGAGTNGGNGALYGGGGGGGSGGTASANSGAGGNGADGIVIITTYF